MKAFDSVPHRRLLNKIYSYGIQGALLGWIKDFLTCRQQRVGVGGSYSDWAEVYSGIPQGSVLGPLLFVLYINDLPDSIKSQIYMYADDTKVFRHMRTDEDQKLLQADLTNMEKWSQKWLLRFHPQKCKIMTIARNKNNSEREYKMTDSQNNDIMLTHTLTEKDLGINIDSELNFEEHLSEKVNKANQIMGLIRRSFSFLNVSTFSQLYKAHVRPHLEYAIQAWHPMRKKDIDIIDKVQKRATKLVPGIKDFS